MSAAGPVRPGVPCRSPWPSPQQLAAGRVTERGWPGVVTPPRGPLSARRLPPALAPVLWTAGTSQGSGCQRLTVPSPPTPRSQALLSGDLGPDAGRRRLHEGARGTCLGPPSCPGPPGAPVSLEEGARSGALLVGASRWAAPLHRRAVPAPGARVSLPSLQAPVLAAGPPSRHSATSSWALGTCSLVCPGWTPSRPPGPPSPL